MRRINAEWNAFITGLVKGNSMQKAQYQTMRRCFYAGFVTFLSILLDEIFELPSKKEMYKVLDELAKEADDFMRELKLAIELEKSSKDV